MTTNLYVAPFAGNDEYAIVRFSGKPNEGSNTAGTTSFTIPPPYEVIMHTIIDGSNIEWLAAYNDLYVYPFSIEELLEKQTVTPIGLARIRKAIDD